VHTTAVTVVVPTRNSGRTLERCLRSLRGQTHSCALVVVDNFSTDDTAAIATSLADTVITAGPERSAQRNLGARAIPAPIVGFIDSDMYVGPTVVADAVSGIEESGIAAIVPERTIGEGYWTSVRAFERSFYRGHNPVEAARFYRWDIFDQLGGFDEHLTGPEDWDLTIRTRELGPIVRTPGWIDHDEGRVRYVSACRRKAYYAEGILRFGRKHGIAALARAGDRPYLHHPTRIANRLGAGLVALKLGESAAVSFALVTARLANGEHDVERVGGR
jgi:glycosyltransferase involved in cell wall biosynthesis